MLDVSPEEPYVTGQLPYLLKAVEWAGKYGLHIIVALYGTCSAREYEKNIS